MSNGVECILTVAEVTVGANEMGMGGTVHYLGAESLASQHDEFPALADVVADQVRKGLLHQLAEQGLTVDPQAVTIWVERYTRAVEESA